MPEGDTVYRSARRLDAALAGRSLVRGELRHPRLVEHDLTGRDVLAVSSVGKHLFIRLDDGRSLHSHLRMDGSWQLSLPGQRWRHAAHHARAVLATADRVAVGFRLHDLALLLTSDEHRLVGHLGLTCSMSPFALPPPSNANSKIHPPVTAPATSTS